MQTPKAFEAVKNRSNKTLLVFANPSKILKKGFLFSLSALSQIINISLSNITGYHRSRKTLRKVLQ